MFRARSLTLMVAVSAIASLQGCACHGDTLVTNGDDGKPDAGQQMMPPPMNVPDAGTDAGIVQPPAGWCASDCDCPGGSSCVATTGELTTNSCAPGTNTCTMLCPVMCGSGTQCTQGV